MTAKAGAIPDVDLVEATHWEAIDWAAAEAHVRRLQARMAVRHVAPCTNVS